MSSFMGKNVEVSYGGTSPLQFEVPVDTTWFDDSKGGKEKKQKQYANRPTIMSVLRQGVDVRNVRDYDGSLITITSGDPGNQLIQTVFGQETDDYSFLTDRKTFQDNYEPTPVELLSSQNITYPIMIDGMNQSLAQHSDLNGVIEPLTIRDLASFNTIYFPFDPHEVRGSLQGGSENFSVGMGSALIVTIDEKSFDRNVPYLDMYEIEDVSGRPANGIFLYESSTSSPFVDEPYNVVVENKLNGSIKDVVKRLNYKDAGYFSDNSMAYSSGYTYDVAQPIDSVAFGGMTYR